MASSARALPLLLAALGCGPADPIAPLDGDPVAGRRIVARVECGVCHVIPGVAGARGRVGPSLEGFAQRRYLGGVAPNRPESLARWVRNAPALAPDTLMPPMPLEPLEARDVAAFLYTLR
jgi:mono/diheme cytochrome c family protein